MRSFNAMGKLKAGVSLEGALADLEAVRNRTKTANPDLHLPPTLTLMPLKDKIVGQAARPLIVLLAASGFVFLIACANVAHLFLARASARRGEVAIRAAIGAGRWRLSRQFFVESALIAAAGAAAGLVVARWSLATIVRILPYGVPRLQETTIDGRALAVAAASAVVAALVFGMVPVWSLWKDDARGVLKQVLTGASPTTGKLRTKVTLVALEFALTIVLLIAAGLLIKSLWRLTLLPEDFQPDRIVTMGIRLTGPAYREESARRAHVAEVLQRVSAVPGVRAAAMTTNADSYIGLVREGEPLPRGPDPAPPRGRFTVTSADFRQVMGLRLTKGRWLTDSEPSRAFVINETLARRHFGDSDPLGARFWAPGFQPDSWGTVVGVVADRKLLRLDDPPEPEVYADYAHGLRFSYSIVASVTIDAAVAAAEVRRAAASANPAVPVMEPNTLETVSRGFDCAVPFQPVHLRSVRCGCAAARVGWHLRHAGVFHVAAHSGDRYPADTRRRTRRGSDDGYPPGNDCRADRHTRRPRHRSGSGAGDEWSLVRSVAQRSVHFRRSLRRAASGGIRGLTRPSPKSGLCSTFDRPSPRVTRRSSAVPLGKGMRTRRDFGHTVRCIGDRHASTNRDVHPGGRRAVGHGRSRAVRSAESPGPCRGRRTVIPTSRASGPTTA